MSKQINYLSRGITTWIYHTGGKWSSRQRTGGGDKIGRILRNFEAPQHFEWFLLVAPSDSMSYGQTIVSDLLRNHKKALPIFNSVSIEHSQNIIIVCFSIPSFWLVQGCIAYNVHDAIVNVYLLSILCNRLASVENAAAWHSKLFIFFLSALYVSTSTKYVQWFQWRAWLPIKKNIRHKHQQENSTTALRLRVHVSVEIEFR